MASDALTYLIPHPGIALVNTAAGWGTPIEFAFVATSAVLVLASLQVASTRLKNSSNLFAIWY